jgi:Predicted membrane protein (DUF2339)/Protein of unknown function (DUF3999)
MEPILVILGLAAVAWLLLGPILVLVMWFRMSRLEGQVQKLEAERKLLPGGRDWAPAAERAAPPAHRPLPLPAVEKAEPESFWIDEPGRPAEVAAEIAGSAPQAIETSGDDTEIQSTASTRPAAREAFSLEELLAGKWMTWVGALAVVIGAGFGFKYAIDNEYLGPTGRVVLGILTGMACFVGGAFAMLRNYRFLGQGLVGAALGILYASLVAADRWYGIIPQQAAFLAMIAVTMAGLAFSAVFSAQPTACLGLLGGFLSPVMLARGTDERWILFSYILVLDLGVLGIAAFRKWRPLQNLAFACTVIMWIGWFSQHYTPEKFTDTVLLLTPFFLVFALLGIFHNVLRRTPAEAGDFFLILATPVAYFAALYGITNRDYAAWQGLLAVAMAAVYLGFAVFAMQRNPAGRKIVIALAGVAASFLTLAVPLQLTGHWIAIAWAGEAVLLVELGLRFGEVRLRQAGFGLLVVVQMILAFYSVETFSDPRAFDSRFQRDFGEPAVVPMESLAMSGSMETTVPETPGWTSVFNGRSFSFLASALAMGVLAWEYRRRRPVGVTAAGSPVPESLLPSASTQQMAIATGWLMAAVPLSLMALLIVESFSFGRLHDWLFPTFIGLFMTWTALAALVVFYAAATIGPRWLQRIGIGLFGLLAVFIAASLLGTVGGWGHEWMSYKSRDPGAVDSIWTWALVNPRGLGFIATVAAASLAAWFLPKAQSSGSDAPGGKPQGIGTAQQLGIFAHLTGLALLTSEVYAQGIIREWHTGTSLAVTLGWTVYAVGTLVAGIYFRTTTVRILALALFALTTAKVFLFDVWQLSTVIRTFAFVALGASLLLVSFLYRRYRDRIRAWITTTAVILAIGSFAGASRAEAADGPDGAGATLQHLTHRWPIDASARTDVQSDLSENRRTFVKLTLPAEIYGIARGDLADLRIYTTPGAGAAAMEVPFLVVHPHDSSRVAERSAPLLDLSEIAGNTAFLLDLGDAVEPVNRLTIQINDDDRNYERNVAITAADRRDVSDWNVVSRKGYLLDVTRAGHRLTVGTIDIPQSRFRYYKISIANQGQSPLRVTGARLFDRVEERATRRPHDARIVSRDHDSKSKQTRVVFDLQHERQPTVGITLDVAFDGYYYRPVSLESADDLTARSPWRTVTASQIYRIDRKGVAAEVRHIDYSTASGRYLRITIADGDDRPLDITGARADSIDAFVVAESRNFDDKSPATALYAGNPRLNAPSYDLARTAEPFSIESVPELTLGPVEKNPLYQGPAIPGRPWSEQHQPILWTGVIIGVLVLGGLTVFVLQRAAVGSGNERT